MKSLQQSAQNRLTKRQRIALSLMFTPLVALNINSLHAEEQTVKEQESNVEKIIVTGSRLRSGNQVSKAPINTINEEAFELTGNLSVADAINELPQLGASFGSQSQNINSLNDGFNAGTSLVNLRNLGSKRTLVLVNGRRHVGGDPGTSSVDLNAIPAGMIDRIDVVTGAASAVYGADAVSGVVNIILKNDYDGFKISGRYGQATEQGDGEEKSTTITFGHTLDDDKGSFLVSAEVSKSEAIMANDRWFGEFDGCNFTVDASCGSSAIEGGRLRNIGINGDYTFDEQGAASLWDGTRYNRLPNRNVQVPVDKKIVSSVFNYSLFEQGESSANLFLEASFSNSEAVLQMEPQFFWFRRNEPQYTAGFNQQLIPVDNPYMLSAIEKVETLTGESASLNPNGVELLRRITELGVRSSKSERDSYRFLIGMDGDISENWSYEVYFQQGKVTANQIDNNTLNKQRFYAGLNVDDNGTTGDLSDDTCRDAAFVALGCTPVDLFGSASITQDFLDYSLIDVQSNSQSEQDVYSAVISGETFELPAGWVGLVVGAEYREESSVVRADEALQDGTAATRSLQSISGDYDVFDVFAETNIPVLTDVGIINSFNIGAAVRVSDYSTIGNEVSWSLKADMLLNDDIRLRTTYGTAVRAPNINELFSPVQSGTTSIIDPCDTDGGALVLEEETASNCADIIGSGSTTFDQTQIQSQTVMGQTGGNGSLEAEEAETLSVGLVLTPTDDFMLTMDYYKIELDNAISTFGLQDIVNQCATGGVEVFCSQVERDGAGQIVAVNNALINAASEDISGVDIQATYSTSTEYGDFDVNVNYSHLINHSFVAFEGEAKDELAGQVGDFDDRVNTQVVFTRGAFSLAWNSRWLSSANADNLLVDSANPLISEGNNIDDVIYHDAQASYNFGQDENYNITLGIKNLLDEQPPIITQPARTQLSGANTVVGGIYDTRGRFVYLNLSASF